MSVVNGDGELCDGELSMGKESSTGSMNNHIRLKHNIIPKANETDNFPVPLKKTKETMRKIFDEW